MSKKFKESCMVVTMIVTVVLIYVMMAALAGAFLKNLFWG